MDQEKVECTSANVLLARYCVLHMWQESVEHILYCPTEFLEAANEYGWQGQVRFQKYRKTLTGNATTKWDLSVAGGPQNFQIASFFQNLCHMIAQMAGPQAYDKFVKYMHHVKKPASMDPSTLVDRAQTLFHYVTYLPIDENTAGPEIPVAQQKRMMLNMFPEPWVRNFTNGGQNPSTVTIVTLLSYMNEQHSAEVIDNECKHSFNYGGQNDNTKRMRDNSNGHQSHNEGPDGHSDNTNGNYSQHGASNSHEHDYHAHNGHPNGNNHTHNGHANGNHRGSFPPIQQDDESCIHGGHLWRKCYLNPRWDNTTAPVYGACESHGDESYRRQTGQHYSIINGSSHSSRAELQRTSYSGGAPSTDAGWNGPDGPPPHLIG
jgi:hypothetical protein